MKGGIFLKYLRLISVIVCLFCWEMLGFFSFLPPYVLPRPSAVFLAFLENYKHIFAHTKITLLETGIGLFWAVLISFFLAICMDRWRFVYTLVSPWLVFSQTLPTMAIAPLLLLWLGYGMLPKIFLVVLTTAFPLTLALYDAFQQIDLEYLHLFSLMKATRFQIYWHLKIPMALPSFFTGLKMSVSYALITAVVAEWLGGVEGLGVYMMRAKKMFSYDTMFAILFFLSFLSLFSMKLLELAEKKILKEKFSFRSFSL